MGKRCIVAGCGRSHKEGVFSVHVMPSNPELSQKWIEFVQQSKPNWKGCNSAGVCSVHFPSSAFSLEKGIGGFRRLRLKEGAVPNLASISDEEWTNVWENYRREHEEKAAEMAKFKKPRKTLSSEEKAERKARREEMRAQAGTSVSPKKTLTPEEKAERKAQREEQKAQREELKAQREELKAQAGSSTSPKKVLSSEEKAERKARREELRAQTGTSPVHHKRTLSFEEKGEHTPVQKVERRAVSAERPPRPEISTPKGHVRDKWRLTQKAANRQREHELEVRRLLPEVMLQRANQALEGSVLRGPPDVTVAVVDLNPLLTCYICKGYFVEATTLTDCLHTFCKSCLVRHVNLSLHCPTCDALIHPSNPYANMRLDTTKQDIVHKLLPQVEKEEKKKLVEFYRSRNLPLPGEEKVSTAIAAIQDKLEDLMREVKWTSVVMEYAGSPKEIGKFQPLLKKYLRVPVTTTIGHLQKFVVKKLHLGMKYKAVILVKMSLVHESLSLEAIRAMFFSHQPEDSMLVLKYGVLPSDFQLQDAPGPMEED